MQQQFFQVVVVSLKLQGIAMLKKRIHAQLVVLVLIGLVQRLSRSADSLVVAESSVPQTNFCAKKPAHRISASYRQV